MDAAMVEKSERLTLRQEWGHPNRSANNQNPRKEIKGSGDSFQKELDRVLNKKGGNNDRAMNGGIDMNAANLAMTIKRDGKGVPLPLAQQDMAQLSRLQGLDVQILEIIPAATLPIFTQLQSS